MRELSTVRSPAEFLRKAPFFFGAGIRSYVYLRPEASRALYLAPLLAGVEVNVDVVVFRGRLLRAVYSLSTMSYDEGFLTQCPFEFELTPNSPPYQLDK